MKKKRYEAEGAKEYREAKKRFQKAKGDYIGIHCEEIEICLNKKKKKKKQESIPAGEESNFRETGSSTTIQDRARKCLTEEQEISIWT